MMSACQGIVGVETPVARIDNQLICITLHVVYVKLQLLGRNVSKPLYSLSKLYIQVEHLLNE